MTQAPYIFIKNYDLATIQEQLDAYGEQEQDGLEVHTIHYEIRKTAQPGNLLIVFPRHLPFPEFMFLTMDMYNQVLYTADCEIYGFYPTSTASPITEHFNNQWVVLYTDVVPEEEDELENMKLVTAGNELYEIELADLYAIRLPEAGDYPAQYFPPEPSTLLEQGILFIDKEDYEAEYREDIKNR